MAFQKGQMNGGRRRTIEQVRKDARAAELYRQGLTFDQVGQAFDPPVHKTTAFNMVQRAIRDAQARAVRGPDAFTMILDRIQDHRRKLQEVIDAPHFLVDKVGRIVMTYDENLGREAPVVDNGPVVRAITELRHHIELEAKLLDLFPASKTRVEVVTEDVVDREIEKLAKELGRAGQNQPVQPESPR